MALKEKALKRLAEKMSAAGIPYALGGSWMLCQRGLMDSCHDFDVLVAIEDAERADKVLSRLGMRHAEETSVGFHAGYHFDGADIDLCAGLPLGDSAVYHFAEASIDGTAEVFGQPLPLLCLEDMYVIYAAAGRKDRAALIASALRVQGIRHPDRLQDCIAGEASDTLREALHDLQEMA